MPSAPVQIPISASRRPSLYRSSPPWGAIVAYLVVCTTVVGAAESKQKAFENAWSGRHVVVKRPLYSLFYKEHGLRGSTSARRDGLTVATPFSGTYFRFDGRRRVDDVTEQDVLKIPDAVKLAYGKPELLGDGWNQVIDPVMLTRYDAGTELVVRAARVNLEAVRLELALAGDDNDQDLATSLTIQWPAPLSKSFSERVDVEGVIRQFLSTPE
jgi:hypothetical protein